MGNNQSKLKKENNLELYLNNVYHKECVFKIDREEVEFIQTRIETIIQKACTEWFEANEIIKVGSFYEGTKNHFPDEFDFIMVPSPTSRTAYKDTDLYVPFSSLFADLIHKVEKKDSLNYSSPNLTSMGRRQLYFHRFVEFRGPACKFEFIYKTDSNTERYIHVDLAYAEKLSYFDLNKCKVEQFHRLIASTGSCLVLTEGIYQKYTITETELKFMREELSEKHRKVYRLLKHLINGHKDGEELQDLADLVKQKSLFYYIYIAGKEKSYLLIKGYSSYMIKTMMIYHHYACNNTDEECLGPCVLAVLDEMCKYKNWSSVAEAESAFPLLVYNNIAAQDYTDLDIPGLDGNRLSRHLCLQPYLKCMTDYLRSMQVKQHDYDYDHKRLKSVSKFYMDCEKENKIKEANALYQMMEEYIKYKENKIKEANARYQMMEEYNKYKSLQH